MPGLEKLGNFFMTSLLLFAKYVLYLHCMQGGRRQMDEWEIVI